MLAKEIQHTLTALLVALPLHAEEGRLREVVSESALALLIRTDQHGSDFAHAVIGMMRRFYESLGLLEPSELAQGHWAFVSFPASLLARSLLETMSSEEQTLFEPGYWIQGSHRPPEVLEEQREILRRIEGQRIHSHRHGSPAPIRTVHVAWGVIRLGGAYLVRAREDRKRPEVKGYVFPGGRLDLTDLPVARRSPASLRDLFQADSGLARDALPTTLARELGEELGLLPSEYQAAHKRTLAPFKMLEGSRNNHVYTQYNVAVFAIRLTREGELKVLDRVGHEPAEWAWFTAAELAGGKRVDGASAFVDALSTELGQKTEQFLLKEITESTTTPPIFDTENDSIELRAKDMQPLLKGMTGRERALSFAPSRNEWELLMILGWHSRGLRIQVNGDAVTILGARWLTLNDATLLQTAKTLAKRLEELEFPFVEIDSLGHCRISIDPNQIYFHPDCFEYSWLLENSKKCIKVTLKEIDTHWAKLLGMGREIQLAPKFTKNLNLIEQGKEPDGDFEREHRRHFESTRALGLRKFTSSLTKTYEIVVPPKVP